MPLYLPTLHANISDVSSDQHHARSHDHSSASDGITLSPAGGLNLTGVITAAQITADQNDYNPNGKDTAFLWGLSADAARNITGIAAPAVGGALHWVTNVGSFAITLVHNSGSSTAANRMYLLNAANMVLSANESLLLFYDSGTARWKTHGV